MHGALFYDVSEKRDLNPEKIAADPPRYDQHEIEPHDARMLHPLAPTRSERPMVESRPCHSRQIRHRKNHERIEAERRDKMAVQQMIKRPLTSARRTTPTRQPVKEASRHISSMFGVETVIKPSDREQTDARQKEKKENLKPQMMKNPPKREPESRQTTK